jgi:AAA15 family ATPase/GTPase
MSDGTLRFIAIMTALLTAEEGSLLVIEEIDNGFHPSRAKLLVQFLKEEGFKRKIDVICTTHNPAFLDALGNEMISFISIVHRHEQHGASVIDLLEDLEALPRLLARGSLGKISANGAIESALKLRRTALLKSITYF